MLDTSKITISLFRDGRLKRTQILVGLLEIEAQELLERLDRSSNEGRARLFALMHLLFGTDTVFILDLVLSLQDKNRDTCKVTMRIVESLTTAFDSTIDHLPEATIALEPPASAAVVEAIDSAGEVAQALAQSDIVGSLTSLVDNMSILITIGDEIAKVAYISLLSISQFSLYSRSILGLTSPGMSSQSV